MPYIPARMRMTSLSSTSRFPICRAVCFFEGERERKGEWGRKRETAC